MHIISIACILLSMSTYSSFNVYSYVPRFICTQKYGIDQGTHQSDLGANGDVLVVPDDLVWSLQLWSWL